MPYLLRDSTLTGHRHNLFGETGSSAPSRGALLLAGAPTGRRVVVETFDRADTTGGLGTTDSGHVYKQSSPNHRVLGGAAVKATGSGSIRYFAFVETGVAGDWVLDWEITTSPTTNTTDVGFVIGGVDSTATQGGQVYVSFRKTSTANSVRILHRADTSGADTALLTNSAAGWADATTYTGQIIRSGNTIEITRGGVTIAGPYTVAGAALTALNSGTHQGPTTTNTDAGSRYESWSLFDPAAIDTPPASLTPTTGRVVAHRGTLASAGASTENSVAGLDVLAAQCRPGAPISIEWDVRRSLPDAENPNGVLYCMHDEAGERTHPAMGSLGVEQCTPAQLDAFGVMRLTTGLAAIPGRRIERVNLQHYFAGSATATIDLMLANIAASPVASQVKVMTSISGPYAPAQFRARSWTGPIGTYGSTAANWAGSADGKAADFAAYAMTFGYLPPGGYMANRAHVATLQGAGVGACGSTENSSSTWAAMHADGAAEILTDQADQWLALYEPPALVHEGTAALVATHTLTAGADVARVAAAALTATSTLTAAAVVDQPASAALAATSTLTASGTRQQPAAATMSATSTLAASGTRQQPAAATMSATSTLSAAAAAEPGVAATMTATHTTAAAAVRSQPAAAAMAATHTTAAAGTRAQPAAAPMSATSTLTSAATRTQPAAAAMAATSTLTSAGVVDRPASAAMTATATLTADGTRQQPAAAALTATSSLAAAAVRDQPAAAALAATSTLTAAAVRAQPAAAPLTAMSTLSASATRTQVGAVAMVATSELEADLTPQGEAAAALDADHTLSAATLVTRPAAAAMTATSTTTATSVVARQAAAALTATSSTAASGTLARPAAASLTTSSTLTADGRVVQPAAAALGASSTLTVAATGGAGAAAALSATATLSAAATRAAQVAAVLTAVALLDAAASRTATSTAPMSAAGTLSAEARAAYFAAAHLQAVHTLLASAVASGGRVELTVLARVREHLVLAFVRDHAVAARTRSHTVEAR